MSLTVSILIGVLGLFAGAIVWNIASNQAEKRPLVGPLSGAALLDWLPIAGVARTTGASRERWRVPFEVLAGVFWGLAAHQHGGKLDLAAVLVFSIPLAIVLLVDLWTRFIYTNLILAGIVAGLVFAAAESPSALLRSFVGMVAALLVFALFFVMAAALYRNVNVVPFGLGDVYLAAMIGAMVRISWVAQALFLGIILGGVAAVLMLLSRRVSRRSAVAYGPYLCLGALLVLLKW
jgi:leader peptidase (prepilin peptidase)/N-methyltransferase